MDVLEARIDEAVDSACEAELRDLVRILRKCNATLIEEWDKTKGLNAEYRRLLRQKPCYTQHDVAEMSATAFRTLIVEPQLKDKTAFREAQSLFGTYWIQKNRTVRYVIALLLSKALHKALAVVSEGTVSNE